jgi:hypothetical protein
VLFFQLSGALFGDGAMKKLFFAFVFLITCYNASVPAHSCTLEESNAWKNINASALTIEKIAWFLQYWPDGCFQTELNVELERQKILPDKPVLSILANQSGYGQLLGGNGDWVGYDQPDALIDFQARFDEFQPSQLRLEYVCHRDIYGDSSNWLSNGAVCNEGGTNNQIIGIRMRLAGVLAANYRVDYSCHHTITRTSGGYADGQICGLPGTSINNVNPLVRPWINRLRVTVSRKQTFPKPIALPAPWSNMGFGGHRGTITRYGAQLSKPTNFSYRLCQTKGEVGTSIEISPAIGPEKPTLVLEKGECACVDSPPRIGFYYPVQNDSSGGTYEVFSGGTFSNELTKCTAAELPISFEQPKTIPIRCKKLSQRLPGYYSSCTLPISGGRGNYRVCFPRPIASQENNVEYAPGLLELTTNSRWLRANPELTLFRTHIAPNACMDLINVGEAYVLIGSENDTPDWKPSQVRFVNLSIEKLPKQ